MKVRLVSYPSKGRTKFQIISATEQACEVVCNAFGYGFNSEENARKYLKVHPNYVEVGALPEQIEFTPLF